MHKTSVDNRRSLQQPREGEKKTREAHLTKWRSGSRRPDCAATRDSVVLSPPGMTRASQDASCSGVRTSVKPKSTVEDPFAPAGRDRAWAAFWRELRCSAKPPWRARTPIVRRPMVACRGDTHGRINEVDVRGKGPLIRLPCRSIFLGSSLLCGGHLACMETSTRNQRYLVPRVVSR